MIRDHGKRTIVAFVLFAASMLAGALPAEAADDPASASRLVYQRFVAAQNTGDLAAVEAILLDSPNFLWVSDGMSIWGRDATLARMALFQQAEIWHVDPDLAKAVAVPLDDKTAFLHLPLVLAIGSKPGCVDRVKFLVSVLCIETAQGWRIAALFTTGDKTS